MYSMLAASLLRLHSHVRKGEAVWGIAYGMLPKCCAYDVFVTKGRYWVGRLSKKKGASGSVETANSANSATAA